MEFTKVNFSVNTVLNTFQSTGAAQINDFLTASF